MLFFSASMRPTNSLPLTSISARRTSCCACSRFDLVVGRLHLRVGFDLGHFLFGFRELRFGLLRLYCCSARSNSMMTVPFFTTAPAGISVTICSRPVFAGAESIIARRGPSSPSVCTRTSMSPRCGPDGRDPLGLWPQVGQAQHELPLRHPPRAGRSTASRTIFMAAPHRMRSSGPRRRRVRLDGGPP